jgi:hypothetical protein
MPDQDPSDRQDSGAIRIIQLAGTFEAFGMVVDYLSRTAPFSEFVLGTLAGAIRQQLGAGHHFAAMSGTELVGYAGWLLTSDAVAQAWIDSNGPLIRVPPEQATAAALTTVAVTDPAATRRLMRGARELNKGKRVYFKRGSEGRDRPPRKSSVLIFSKTAG